MMKILKNRIGLLFLILVSLTIAVACGNSAKFAEKIRVESSSVSKLNENSIIDSSILQKDENKIMIENILANLSEDLQVEISKIDFEVKNSISNSVESNQPLRSITTYKINRHRQNHYSNNSNINTQLSEKQTELKIDNEKESVTSDIDIEEKEVRSVKKKVLIRSSYYLRHASYV
ncbi:MAG: hypothetical protein ACTTIA_02525 [Candidatus Cryptobacteroides sp.]